MNRDLSSSGTAPRPYPDTSYPSLRPFGWAETLAAESLPSGCVPARVLAASRGLLLVQTPDGEAWASPSGRFRAWLQQELLQPCAGDWLAVQTTGGSCVARALLPRRTLLARQEAGPSGRAQALASHLDTVCLAMGLDRDFNPARLERLLALAWGSGAAPVVLLTKADLVGDPAPWIARLTASAPGVPVLPLSAPKGLGLEELRALFVEGSTAVLLGSSGVGKSTLLNALLGFEARRTQEVRASDGRGRHTTSLRELFLLPGGGCLIDTPGLREVGLLAEASDLGAAFSDVEAFAARCRYRDCGHDREPGCAVRAALEEGLLDPARFEAFLRLRREVVYAEARADERLWRAREQRWKTITTQARRLAREKR